MNTLKTLLTAAAVVFALPVAAQTIEIEDPYARVASSMSTSGAAFMIIHNKGAEADHLVSAASDIAERVELHTHISDANGVMQMVEVPEGWVIPAGGNLELKRGAEHVMFLGLKRSLAHGDTVSVVLNFAKAGHITVQIPVDLQRGAPAGGMMQGNMGAMAPAAGGMMQGNMGAMAPAAGGMMHGNMGAMAPAAGGMMHGSMGAMAPAAGGMMHGNMGAMAPAPAAGNGLSAPVIMLTPFVRDNADALGLSEAQRAALKAWLERPNQRVVVEGETVALRSELRAAIVSGAPRDVRLALAEKIGANEAKLVMFRSDCADHWRGVLTPEQFAKLLVLAGVTK